MKEQLGVGFRVGLVGEGAAYRLNCPAARIRRPRLSWTKTTAFRFSWFHSGRSLTVDSATKISNLRKSTLPMTRIWRTTATCWSRGLAFSPRSMADSSPSSVIASHTSAGSRAFARSIPTMLTRSATEPGMEAVASPLALDAHDSLRKLGGLRDRLKGPHVVLIPITPRQVGAPVRQAAD